MAPQTRPRNTAQKIRSGKSFLEETSAPSHRGDTRMRLQKSVGGQDRLKVSWRKPFIRDALRPVKSACDTQPRRATSPKSCSNKLSFTGHFGRHLRTPLRHHPTGKIGQKFPPGNFPSEKRRDPSIMTATHRWRPNQSRVSITKPPFRQHIYDPREAGSASPKEGKIERTLPPGNFSAEETSTPIPILPRRTRRRLFQMTFPRAASATNPIQTIG